MVNILHILSLYGMYKELTTILQKIVIVTNNNAWKIGTGAQQSEIRHFDNLQ
jgi:hypothetical protein